MHNSPLRYPGGKTQIAPMIESIIQRLTPSVSTYIEPFAGGAGVALHLLLSEKVEAIIINDYDKAIYSFWKAATTEPNKLIALIKNTTICIDEWHRQKAIYDGATRYSVEYAFATLFLNRANRSGILSAGPIGGYAQDGHWKLNARFNPDTIIERIEKIAYYKKKIKVYNKEIRSFMNQILPRYLSSSFIYFDPPYFHNAKRLYTNCLLPRDHKAIAEHIVNLPSSNWIVTYDDVEYIRGLYKGCCIKQYDLKYCAAKKTRASEIMISKTSDLFCNAELIS